MTVQSFADSRGAPLIITKLNLPLARPDLIPRPRLTERLNVGVERKLTLVSAPAGFGKTTLLGEWVHSDAATASLPVAWVTLDRDDNDPIRFWSYVIAALETLQPGVGETGRALLHSIQLARMRSGSREEAASSDQGAGAGGMTFFLTALINEIVDTPGPLILVLDDYHVIEAQPIHDALIFLLDHLPLQMHLVVASRSDPPLPLARLRARGELVELRASDLRFTSGEAATFLNRVMGLNLSPQDVTALEARTEGWIVGLQLAALSLQGREPKRISEFVRAFAGGHHYVLDYLVEEVLSRQPQHVQSFLLDTAILDQLSGPLCEALTGQGDAQATLAALEGANLFVLPLDNERRWYRYHHLFADFLRVRLGQARPERLTALHRRAAAWYERHGMVEEAIEHRLAAGDFERAAHLIEDVAETALMRSELVTFSHWVDALPDELVRTRPLLCVLHGGALLFSGRPLDSVEARLQDATQSDAAGSVGGQVAVFRALIATFQGDARRSVELSHQALGLLPEESPFLRSIVAGNLGIVYMMSGDVEAAIRAFEEAARRGQQGGNLMLAVMALRRLGDLCVMQGRLHEAQGRYEQALALAVDGRGRRLPIASVALIGLSELLRQWNDLEVAHRHLTEAIALTRGWGVLGVLDAYIVLARVQQAQGEMDDALDTIREAEQLALKTDATELDDLAVAVQQARLWLMQGDVAAAARWVETSGLQAGRHQSGAPLPPYLWEFKDIALARVRIAQEKPDAALALLEPLLPAAEQMGRLTSVIEILILQALALEVRGDVSQALAALERALSLAEPQGYVRLFVDEGEPLARLSRRAAARGIAPDYVKELLKAFAGETKDGGRTTRDVPLPTVVRPLSLVEPLSEREREVLQLLAAGLSNREIAAELVVTVGTVKWHLHNVYGKLDVRNRVEAVARARELNLLT